MIHSFFHVESGQTVYLGRRITPHAEKPPVLRFGAYFDVNAVQPPDSLDFTVGAYEVISQMFLNNKYGCCVWADQFHTTGIISFLESGKAIIGTDDEVYNAYQTVCGPGDNGCDVSSVLTYLQNTGVQMGGNLIKLDGFVAIDWTNPVEVKVAMNILGPLDIAVSLPGDWENSQIWDNTNSGIVGGHDICSYGYNSKSVRVGTWGSTREFMWDAFTSRQYVGELYARLWPLWYAKNMVNPYGIDVATMKSDMDLLKNGQIPDINPTHLFNWHGFA
jgi:hypothetical protein